MRSIITLFSLFAFFVITASVFSQETQTYTGLVIHAEPGEFTVKKGSQETGFLYDSRLETVLLHAEADSKVSQENQMIEICQTVRVTYVKEGDVKIAMKVEILKESGCYQ